MKQNKKAIAFYCDCGKKIIENFRGKINEFKFEDEELKLNSLVVLDALDHYLILLDNEHLNCLEGLLEIWIKMQSCFEQLQRIQNWSTTPRFYMIYLNLFEVVIKSLDNEIGLVESE